MRQWTWRRRDSNGLGMWLPWIWRGMPLGGSRSLYQSVTGRVGSTSGSAGSAQPARPPSRPYLQCDYSLVIQNVNTILCNIIVFCSRYQYTSGYYLSLPPFCLSFLKLWINLDHILCRPVTFSGVIYMQV